MVEPTPVKLNIEKEFDEFTMRLQRCITEIWNLHYFLKIKLDEYEKEIAQLKADSSIVNEEDKDVVNAKMFGWKITGENK